MGNNNNNNNTKHLAWFMCQYFDTPSIEDLHEIGICASEIALFVGGGDGDGDQFDESEFYVRLVNPMSLRELTRAWDRVVDWDGDSKTPHMQECKDMFRKESRYVKEQKKCSHAWLLLKASAEELAQFKKSAPVENKKRPIEAVAVQVVAAAAPPAAKKTKSTLSEIDIAVCAKLETFPEGVVAPVLAKAMGLDKSAVNKALYNLEKINVAVKVSGFGHAGGSGKPVWRRVVVQL